MPFKHGEKDDSTFRNKLVTLKIHRREDSSAVQPPNINPDTTTSKKMELRT